MKSLLDSSVDRLGSALRAFPVENADAYADWLAQTYYYVRHSTRLLAAAAARFSHDELGDQLHQRFSVHMAEEKRHELLTLNDLRTLKRSIDQLPERHSTRAFYEVQYFKVEHQDPVSLFGYILALEAMSAVHGPALFERAKATHSAPAATFLKVHAQDDEDHLQKALAMLEQIDPSRCKLVEINIAQSTFSYLTLLADIRGSER